MSQDDYQPHTVTIPLLPCPFCGEALVECSDHHGSWMAHESKSLCWESPAQIMDDADAKQWNTRA